jgi:putative transcriptional regulator
MKTEDFESLKRGMAQAKAYMEDGKREGFVVHTPLDIKAVRAKTKLSQDRFARTYGLEVTALRDWEQGRRTPDRAAQTLISLIDRAPDTVAKLLAL